MFGIIGILQDDGLKVQCHICGKWYRSVSLHIAKTHRMTQHEYKKKFGLKRTQKLISHSLSKQISVKQRDRLSQYWRRKPELTEFNKTKIGTRIPARKQTLNILKESNRDPQKVAAQREKMKGRTLTEEHKMKIASSLKGRTFTEEHRKNLSKAMMKKG